MIRKRYPLPVRRYLRMADPVDAVEEHLPDRILQTPVSVLRYVTDYRHILPVRRPVRVLHIVEHFSRRSAAHWNPRQRSRLRKAAKAHRVEPNRQFPALRDGQQFRALYPEFARARVIRAPHIQLAFASVPRSAV